jgi:two-component system, cell cycle sensor histidine kinase and response regulator CckA
MFKLLIAARDRQKVEQVKQAFDHCDCQVIPAPSMSLALFLTQKNLPDLILADTDLTDGDGIKLLQELKSEPELRAIPFIFYVSPSNKTLDEKQALIYGAAALLNDAVKDTDLYDFTMPLIQSRVVTKGKRQEETPE